MTTPLTRELALKIGLAARALPGITSAQLLDVLLREVGLPLTEAGVAGLKPKDLRAALTRQGLGEELTPAACKQAIDILREGVAGKPDLPQPQPYQDGDMPNSIRVACAANSADLDGHFGSCLHFLVYQVSATERRLIDLRATAGDAAAEDKNAFRAELIGDCQVLVVQSIGGPAAAKVIKAGLHPLKLPVGGTLDTVLGDLQHVLAGSPPPWLAKVMGVSAEERARFVREEAAS